MEFILLWETSTSISKMIPQLIYGLQCHLIFAQAQADARHFRFHTEIASTSVISHPASGINIELSCTGACTCILRTASWSDLLISCTAVEEEIFSATTRHSIAACKGCRCWNTRVRCCCVSCFLVLVKMNISKYHTNWDMQAPLAVFCLLMNSKLLLRIICFLS